MLLFHELRPHHPVFRDIRAKQTPVVRLKTLPWRVSTTNFPYTSYTWIPPLKRLLFTRYLRPHCWRDQAIRWTSGRCHATLWSWRLSQRVSFRRFGHRRPALFSILLPVCRTCPPILLHPKRKKNPVGYLYFFCILAALNLIGKIIVIWSNIKFCLLL